MESVFPSLDEAIYPAYKIAALVDTLADDGVGASDALRGSGIAPERLHAPSTRISFRQMQAVYQNAMQLAQRPAIALRAGEQMHITAAGMYGYALLSSATVLDACRFSVRYQRVTGAATVVSFEVGPGRVVWTYDPILSLDPDDELYRFSMEFQFSINHTVFKDYFGPTFGVDAMSAAYRAPSHAADYRTMFGVPVRFAQPSNEMTFAASWLEHRPAFSNQITHATMRELCENALDSMTVPLGIAGKIHQRLLMQPGRFVTIDVMASELGLSERTLRRRLDEERTNFQQILLDVRRHLALRYLRETSMSNEEIAERLGYSDAANFRHAFKRWTGKQPSLYRTGGA